MKKILSIYSENMHIYIGAGTDHSIGEITKIASDIIGFNGDVFYNLDKPLGAKRKLLDSSRIKLGWRPKIDKFKGMKSTMIGISKT